MEKLCDVTVLWLITAMIGLVTTAWSLGDAFGDLHAAKGKPKSTEFARYLVRAESLRVVGQLAFALAGMVVASGNISETRVCTPLTPVVVLLLLGNLMMTLNSAYGVFYRHVELNRYDAGYRLDRSREERRDVADAAREVRRDEADARRESRRNTSDVGREETRDTSDADREVRHEEVLKGEHDST